VTPPPRPGVRERADDFARLKVCVWKRHNIRLTMKMIFNAEMTWIICVDRMYTLYTFQGTNEMLRLFISLTCLQHAGLELIEMVKSVSSLEIMLL